jgi:hypothetical protein
MVALVEMVPYPSGFLVVVPVSSSDASVVVLREECSVSSVTSSSSLLSF